MTNNLELEQSLYVIYNPETKLYLHSISGNSSIWAQEASREHSYLREYEARDTIQRLSEAFRDVSVVEEISIGYL